MAMLAAYCELKRVLKVQMTVMHVFHGPSASDHSCTEYRNNARRFVSDYCKRRKIDFFSNIEETSSAPKISFPDKQNESALRQFRYQIFEQLMSQANSTAERQVLLLGHHQDDALETQLLHLIRGSGLAGLQSFSEHQSPAGNQHFDGEILRPMLKFSKKDLGDFVTRYQIPCIEDPSNSGSDPLRNWLRREWLPALEAKRQGGASSLGRSIFHLGNLLSDTTGHLLMSCLAEEGVSKREFLKKTPTEKSFVMSEFMKRSGIFDFSHSHIEEFLKRLDREQKNHTFIMLGRRWTVSADWIKVSVSDVP